MVGDDLNSDGYNANWVDPMFTQALEVRARGNRICWMHNGMVE
jgi:hypothetical protein